VLAAGPLVALLAPGFRGYARDLTVPLVQILFPGVALLVMSAWCLGVLNSHRRFFLSYVSPVLWNAALIAAAVIAGRRLAGRGDPAALIVVGAVMVGAILRYKPPVTLAQTTPVARLMAEYNAFAVRADSPLKTMRDLVERMKRDPGGIKWGGGSKGSVDHLSVAMIARIAGIDATRLNYVPFKGGGEAAAAMLGGHITVGTSGWAELQEYIVGGQLRALAITAPQRVKGIAIPTLREQGIAIDIGNWRGVHAAPGLSAAQRQALIDAVVKATATRSWQQALERNGWTPLLLTGTDFERFVEAEHGRLRALMHELGMS
jgi:putative tricarboxylic transport membrane protein